MCSPAQHGTNIELIRSVDWPPASGEADACYAALVAGREIWYRSPWVAGVELYKLMGLYDGMVIYLCDKKPIIALIFEKSQSFPLVLPVGKI